MWKPENAYTIPRLSQQESMLYSKSFVSHGVKLSNVEESVTQCEQGDLE